MTGMPPDRSFWRGKRVVLTGHTGFKGAWLALWLRRLGAEVTGIALDADSTSWEQEPLAGLARDGELMAYAHSGFWQPMDTLRERNLLEELWQSGRAPWKRW